MTRAQVKPWISVALYAISAVAIIMFAFIPYNKRARIQTRAVASVTATLTHNLEVITQLPGRKSELDSLVRKLDMFRKTLHQTDEVEAVMQALERRANAAGVSFWTLDPSIPALVSMENSKDSVAALDLALLPVRFECHGTFLDVGAFLEAEQQREAFCRWSRLTVNPSSDPSNIRATGEILMFLLPEENFRESSS